MTLKYAGSEVLQMAVEIEKKGKSFYDNAVRMVKDQKSRDLFKILAEDELQHERIFQKILSEVETKINTKPYDNREVTLYFRALIDRKIFPSEKDGEFLKKEVSDPNVVIMIALSFEKDSVLFYHELLPFTREKDHTVINRIIDEERDHISRILELKSDLED